MNAQDDGSDPFSEGLAKFHNPYLFLELEEQNAAGALAELTVVQAAHAADEERPSAPSDYRRELADQLDDMLGQYQPNVSKPDWFRVLEFRPAFLDQATRTPELARRTSGRLMKLRLSLMPGEKVEYNRAPADRIIAELRKLLS